MGRRSALLRGNYFRFDSSDLIFRCARFQSVILANFNVIKLTLFLMICVSFIIFAPSYNKTRKIKSTKYD